ncbi:hypothetical protein [Streptomyces sp. H51]|uniref:hypothetical protein n=1 Tax=Streptomyces sp. H51 TaxID=3111770 RepID=UPI002D7998E4|nr:hypothetical protein [Streptomyces sp. H51]
MNNPVRLLHIAYWTGAVADGAMLVPLLVPKAAGAMLGIDRFAPGSDYRYATAVGAALMAGWTALLVWADRRPVERRGVLLLTVFPVLVGLVAAGVYAVTSGFVELPYLIPVFGFQTGACTLFGVAYLRARGFEHAGPPADNPTARG